MNILIAFGYSSQNSLEALHENIRLIKKAAASYARVFVLMRPVRQLEHNMENLKSQYNFSKIRDDSENSAISEYVTYMLTLDLVIGQLSKDEKIRPHYINLSIVRDNLPEGVFVVNTFEHWQDFYVCCKFNQVLTHIVDKICINKCLLLISKNGIYCVDPQMVPNIQPYQQIGLLGLKHLYDYNLILLPLDVLEKFVNMGLEVVITNNRYFETAIATKIVKDCKSFIITSSHDFSLYRLLVKNTDLNIIKKPNNTLIVNTSKYKVDDNFNGGNDTVLVNMLVPKNQCFKFYSQVKDCLQYLDLNICLITVRVFDTNFEKYIFEWVNLSNIQIVLYQYTKGVILLICREQDSRLILDYIYNVYQERMLKDAKNEQNCHFG